MIYDDYLKLKEYLNKTLEKLYKKRDIIEDFIQKTQLTRTAKVEVAHIEELCCNLEEAVNQCDWFIGVE